MGERIADADDDDNDNNRFKCCCSDDDNNSNNQKKEYTYVAAALVLYKDEQRINIYIHMYVNIFYIQELKQIYN